MEPSSAAVGGSAPWERHGWLALAALPLFLLACNHTWILTIPAGIDTWLYYGYFTNFSALWREFPSVYYGTRLGWLLPGAIAHAVLPSLAANAVLHLGVYYTAVFAIYVTVKRLYGARTALLVAALLGNYSYFLVSAGWNYVDGAGLAYYAVTVALLIRPTRAGVAWWVPLAAGATFAAAVHTHLVLGVFLPILVLTYLRLPAADARQKYLHAACFLAGALVLTAGFGLEAYRRGAPFLFFLPSLRFAAATAAEPDAYMTNPLWMLNAPFLVVPAVAAVAVLTARIRMRGGSRRLDCVVLDHFLLSIGMFLLFLALGRPFLKLGFYVSYLIPSLFLAIAPVLWPRVRELSTSAFAIVLAAVLVIPGLLLLPVAGKHLDGLVQPLVVAVPLLILATGAAWLAIRKGIAALLVFVVLFAVANVMMVRIELIEFEQVSERGDGYEAIVRADRLIASHDEGQGRFWYDARAPLGDIFRAIASTRLWAYRLVSDRFPTFIHPTSQAEAPVGSGDRIIVLGVDRDRTFAQAHAAIRSRGLDVVLTNDDLIEAGSVRFHMLSLRVEMDRSGVDTTAAPVLVDVFEKGYRGAAREVEIAAAQDRIRIATDRSTFDWQMVSVPIPVLRDRRYMVEFEITVPEGGAGLHVVNPDANNAVLASRYWCKPTPRHAESMAFETGQSDKVLVALSNCGDPAPIESEFTVDKFRLLRLR